jgi:hypothetical protein
MINKSYVVTLKEEHKLQMPENKLPKNISGPKRMKWSIWGRVTKRFMIYVATK